MARILALDYGVDLRYARSADADRARNGICLDGELARSSIIREVICRKRGARHLDIHGSRQAATGVGDNRSAVFDAMRRIFGVGKRSEVDNARNRIGLFLTGSGNMDTSRDGIGIDGELASFRLIGEIALFKGNICHLDVHGGR